MNDPFAWVAVIVSAAIIPFLLFVLLCTIRRVANEHRDTVQQRFRHDRAIDPNWQALPEEVHASVLPRTASSLNRGKEFDSAYSIAPAKITSYRSGTASYQPLEESHLPETFDKVYDDHMYKAATPAMKLAARRSLLQEMDLGLAPLQPREMV